MLDAKGTGLSCPDVKVNRPEPTDLSIFIAQIIELFKEKMNSAGRDMRVDFDRSKAGPVEQRKWMEIHQSVGTDT
ncbi:MAG: hypothetical protein ABI857_08855 [Acidobacteriota bacterium]